MREQNDQGFNYILGLVSFAVVFVLVWGLWYVFMHPNAVMKLYTPMYGFSLVVGFLASVVLLSKVFERGGASPVRGVLWTALSILLMLVLVYGFFWSLIGRYGITYFSPYSIIDAGGVGAEMYNARENSSTAIVYFFTAFLWVALTWCAGFNRWPWATVSPGVRGWSKLFAVSFFSVIVYVVFFHPHVCHLFYPAQTMAGVEPWWSEYAQTGSAFFSLGLLLCVLAWVVVSDLLWEGYPWQLAARGTGGSLYSGLFALAGTVALGFLTQYLMLKFMNYRWDTPFMGGQYTDGPDFRYLHSGEMAGCFILAAFILKTYANNVPRVGNLFARGLARTVLAGVLAVGIYLFYYSPAADALLGKVAGIAQPGDTPLVWIILYLGVIMVHEEFLGAWPQRRR